MEQIKEFTNKNLKLEKERKKVLADLDESLIRDRKFLSNYTNEEFIKYELSRNSGLTEKYLIKLLKKYGYISTNTGSILINDQISVISTYSAKIDETMKYCG
jgi:type II secretory pathway component HofQ